MKWLVHAACGPAPSRDQTLRRLAEGLLRASRFDFAIFSLPTSAPRSVAVQQRALVLRSESASCAKRGTARPATVAMEMASGRRGGSRAPWGSTRAARSARAGQMHSMRACGRGLGVTADGRKLSRVPWVADTDEGGSRRASSAALSRLRCSGRQAAEAGSGRGLSPRIAGGRR